jgi:SAM-dependent methyltransferase
MLRDAWDAHADAWVTWARTPGHDSYWRFHRDSFLPLVPPPGRLTLDIGCGEGRVGRDLTRLGHRVIGLDASSAMAAAANAHHDSHGPIVVADAAALPVSSVIADCVVAFMSLQDVDDMERAVGEAARLLVPGGHLVLAIVHPLNSAGRFEPDAGGGTPPFVIAGSWYQRRSTAETCERDGLTMTFHSEHRPLRDYANALADAGFMIERIQEVGEPDPRDKWNRIPLFLHVRARCLS